MPMAHVSSSRTGSNSLSLGLRTLVSLAVGALGLATSGCFDTSTQPSTQPGTSPTGTVGAAGSRTGTPADKVSPRDALQGNVSAKSLELSETQFAFATDVDGAPEVRTLSLTTSPGPLRWFGNSKPRWLAVAPAVGNGSSTLVLRATPKGLAPGRYVGRVTFEVQGGRSLQAVDVTYTVHAKRGASVYDGNAQVAVIDNELTKPLTVQVLDSEGKPKPGVKVDFETIAGSTEPPSFSVESDANGLARFQPKILQFGAIGITASTALEHDSPAHFSAVQ